MLTKLIFGTLLTFSLGQLASAQVDGLPKTGMDSLRDEEVVSKIASTNGKEASRAAVETFKRGEKMLPLLFKMRGADSLYHGYCLNDYKGGVAVRRPNEDTSSKDADVSNGWYVTVEATSLFLISAIYYDNLSFAAAPYLLGGHRISEGRFNTPERLKLAWNATDAWHKKLQKHGLSGLRQRKEDPFHSTKLYFSGLSPNRKRDISDCVSDER